jgi:starch-binding outer membrane protein, SusD/RagB family
MKKILYSTLFTAALTLMIISCSKTYLETSPTDQVSAESAFTTTANAMQALNGIHRSMYFQWANQGEAGEGSMNINRDMLGEDLVMTSSGNGWYNTTYQWLAHRTETGTTPYFPWRMYYRFIANANMIINNIDKAVGSDADKNAIKGEALVYRAWSHFQLVQLFGKRYDATTVPNTQLGVPIMLTNNFDGQPRNTVEEVYTQINTDIDAAITLLTGYTRANKSHFNVNVAKGIKARVALAMQNYPIAATFAAQARAGFTLMSNATYQAGFNDYTNSEWMWGSTVITDQTTYFYSFFAYMSYNFSSTNIRGNPKAINSVLYNLIPATDVRKWCWDPVAASVPAPPALWMNNPTTFSRFNYMNRKFKAVDGADSRGDVCYMRAAEMYLIEAEALARQGQDVPARAALYTLAFNRDPGYVLSTNSGAALINEIMFQRRIELWGEGFRFTDLKRLNLPLDRTGANHNISLCLVASIPAGDVRWQWLIPKDELNSNKNMVQNDL